MATTRGSAAAAIEECLVVNLLMPVAQCAENILINKDSNWSLR